MNLPLHEESALCSLLVFSRDNARDRLAMLPLPHSQGGADEGGASGAMHKESAQRFPRAKVLKDS
jgi:hypothetical protein